MSWEEVFYETDMNDDEESEDPEVVWDDRKLIDAYEEAMKISYSEVAESTATSTNTKTEKESEQSPVTLPDMSMSDMSLLRSLDGMEQQYPPPTCISETVDDEEATSSMEEAMEIDI